MKEKRKIHRLYIDIKYPVKVNIDEARDIARDCITCGDDIEIKKIVKPVYRRDPFDGWY